MIAKGATWIEASESDTLRVATGIDGYMDYGHVEFNARNAEAKRELRSLSKRQIANLSYEEEDAAWIYSGAEWQLMQRNPQSAEYRELVAGLDSALTRNTLGRNTILYRGIQARFSGNVGDTFRKDGFTSCSFDQSIENTFAGGTIFRIKASSGQMGLALESVSQYAEEHEFLLPRNTKFRVVSIVRGSERLYVDLEIIETKGD